MSNVKFEVARATPEQVVVKMGQLWQHEDGEIYIVNHNRVLISLEDGNVWSDTSTFSGSEDEFTYLGYPVNYKITVRN